MNTHGIDGDPRSTGLSAEMLTRRVKDKFNGESQNSGESTAASTPAQELLPLGESTVETQIAVITPPEISQLLAQTDTLIQAGNLTPEDVEAAMEVAQAGGLTTPVKRSGREFLFPKNISKEWKALVAVFMALLFVLAMATTACAADNSAAAEAPQSTAAPALLDIVPQPPAVGGGDGETPTPPEVVTQQTCTFDTPRNLRTSPSATAGTTTLDGSGATVANKEYDCFEKVKNTTDQSDWARLTPDGQLPQVWAVLVHPGLGLTGGIREVIVATGTTAAVTIDSTNPSAETTPHIEQVVVNSEMEAKLRELIKKYPLMFPDALVAQLNQMNFDTTRGGWVDPKDANYIYVPTKTSPYETTTATSLLEMKVWMPSNNFVVNPATGSKIYFGVGEGALIETLQWANTPEKGAGYVRIFEDLLKLPPGVNLRFITMKDVTLQTAQPDSPSTIYPPHLPDKSDLEQEIMLLVRTTTENVQMYFEKDSAGKLVQVTILMSVTDGITDDGKRPPEMWASTIAWNQSGIAYTVLLNSLAGKPITDVSSSYAYLNPFRDALKGLYDKDATGKYIPNQMLFKGKAR